MCLLILALVLGVVQSQSYNFRDPQQVHIAYGDDVSNMIITWSTLNDTNSSTVMYGLSFHFNESQSGISTKFVDGGREKRFQFIHRVELVALAPNTRYYYSVGSMDGWSDIFSFRTMQEDEDWGPGLLVFGDMGAENAQSLPRLEFDAMTGDYDAVLHVGDFAYDLDKDNARVGDEFMQMIQPLAANVPYMTCVGNHEYAYNFANYKARFNMPKDNGKMYYSFNMGLVHIISVSTEFFYFPYLNYDHIGEQYNWLRKDLEEANSAENRTKRPWIITIGHRPMYCSNNDNDDCSSFESLVRVGAPLLGVMGLESLFYNYGVDMSIWAHEHSYERLWPVYDRQVMNGSLQFPYTNNGGIIHITTGSAGCSERHEYFQKNPPAWSAFHSSDYGYTRMKFANKTHLFVEQVSDDKGGAIIDKFTVIKDKHGSYESPKKK